MALVSLRDVSWGTDEPPLLENITLQIEKGERVCLLGRNGVGKSTLLKLIGGDMRPDDGDIWREQGAAITAMPQEVPPDSEGAIFEVVARGMGRIGCALAEHHRILRRLENKKDDALAERRDELQRLLDAEEGWALLPPIESILSRTELEPEKPFAELSAGMKRRVLFARAMAPNPDLLLLDEPTNHLDIDAIDWMEEFILRHVKTLLFITHDRSFLKRIATRVMELDRGRLTSYACDYATYLVRKEAEAEAEEQQNRNFDKKLSREEVWIRQGIKARRTRNEGRVRALLKLREAARARRKKTGDVRLRLQDVEKSGKLVIEADGVTHRFGSQPIVQDFSTVIVRGDKVGILGPNGAGKTTLLNILLKKTVPDSGYVRHGTQLQVAYFDQLRSQLDEQKTVVENVGEGNDFIIFNGRQRHVIGYLQDFLFSPERARTPIHVLSGGERNRLLLARLFTRPANVLVLDEPTNDLDAETLELLEDLLVSYEGTLLLVSHDRTFLNNVVASTIVFEGRGRVVEYAGGYDDWLDQRPKETVAPAAEKKDLRKNRAPSPRPKKLGYRQMQELAELPQKIERLEAEQKEIHSAMSDPLFYKKEKAEISALKKRLDELTMAIEAAYLRWEDLEGMKALD